MLVQLPATTALCTFSLFIGLKVLNILFAMTMGGFPVAMAVYETGARH